MHQEPLSGRDLAAFVTAVETGSMHGTADALGLTQSAVSKRIHHLEARTGVALLERDRTGVRPTDAGRVLYPEAKQALDALDRAAAVAGEASSRARHALSLAASHTIGEFLLPRWIAAFRALEGEESLQVRVDVTNSPRVLAQVRAGLVEIGFVEGVDSVADLESVTLLRDTLVVVVATGHRWTRRREVAAESLAQEQYLARESDSGTRAVTAATLARHGLALEPALETPSIQGLKRAVLGGGFTIISQLTVRDEVRSGTLTALPVRGIKFDRRLRAVRSGPPWHDGPSRRLWAWLRSGRGRSERPAGTEASHLVSGRR